MTCSKCGKPLKPDTRFCPSCGTPVELAAIGNLISDQDPRISTFEAALGNKYKILRKIGAGGFADVYLGEHTQLGRNVAIKILRVAEDEEMIERFRRESRAVAKLSHPNIIDIYDVGDSGDIYYFVMKYIAGETLSHRMRRTGKTEPGIAIHVIKQLADALAYAHDRGVIHRDIKPANVLLDDFGKPVLMDFGIARLTVGGQLTRTGTLMGTPHYLPPEQPLGKSVDGRSDIYSLGIMFYEMLAGRVPFHDDAAIALIYKHINEPPPPLRQLAPELAPSLVDIVHKMIEKQQENRYQSAYEVYEALDALTAVYPFQTAPAGIRRGTPETVRNTEKLFLLADQHAKEKKYVQAMEIYSTIFQRHPDHSEARKKVDSFLSKIILDLSHDISNKDFDKAKAIIGRLEQLRPSDNRVTGLRSSLDREEQRHRKDMEFRTHYESAQAALKHDNAAGAVEYLTKALTVDPENEDAKTLLRQARAEYEKNRRKAELLNIITEAEYYFNNGSYEDALSAIQKGLRIELTPEVTQLHEKIQNALQAKEQQEEERTQIYLEVDQLCQELNFQEAKVLLEQVRSKHPDLVQSLAIRVDRARELHSKFVEAEDLLEQSKWEESTRAYYEFLENSASPDFQIFSELRKQAEKSLEFARQKLLDLEIDQMLKKADVFLRMGQLAQAKEECQKILQRKSDHAAALAKLRDIESKLRPQVQDAADTGELLRELDDSYGPATKIETETRVVSAEPPPPPPPAPSPPPSQVAENVIPQTDKVKKPTLPPPPAPPSPAPYAPPVKAKVPATAGPPIMLILGGVFILILLITGVVLFWPSGSTNQTEVPVKHEVPKPPDQKKGIPSPPPPQLPAAISVSIDAQPWANIEISGSNLKKSIAETTPVLVSLVPGKYSVTFKNPDFRNFEKEIDITQDNRKFQFQFEQLDAEKLADTVVK